MQAEKWIEYAQWENDADRLGPMEKIFANTLLQIPHVALWDMYLKYVRRRNPVRSDNDRAYKIISDAFDFALRNIGLDKDSGEIWREYLNFLKTGPGAVTLALESIWKDYNNFEMGLNKVNVSSSQSIAYRALLTF